MENIFIFGQNQSRKQAMRNFITFGERIRFLREEAHLTLREVAGSINIDSSLLAKVERNERQPTKQLIKEISTYFKVSEKELLSEFLSDQIAYKILDEEAGLDILKIAEEKVSYLKTLRNE